MRKGLNPVETFYNGIKFRSRLEARWAVFFDAMGWHWEYEIEGFNLGNDGCYLPDFHVYGPSGVDGIYEVKPVLPSKREQRLALSVGASFLVGQPYLESPKSLVMGPVCHYSVLVWEENAWAPRAFVECRVCKQKWGISGPYDWVWAVDGIDEIIETGVCGAWGICGCTDKDDTDTCWSDLLTSAYIAARSARFEHGEAPILHRKFSNLRG